MIRSLFARGARRWRPLTLSAAVALASAVAGAQQPTPPNDQEPVGPQRARTFRLFGLADQAFTGMRQGGRSSWSAVASGPSDIAPGSPSDLPGRVIGTASSPNGYCCGYFEIQMWAAAARGDWARARDEIPSLENVQGGGWNARTQLSRWTSIPEQLVWQGRDASIGSLFSGVVSTSGDGSCLDNNSRANNFIDPGAQLLAGSDCPPTWVNPARFDGERVVPDTVWLNEFRNRGSNFTWDDWKFPASRRDESRLYGSFQTFGATNDYGREVRQNAGAVIPGGTGKPKIEGYPLGIEWEFNSWTYSVPSLGDAMFYKANIINKSALVYGTGIDYDSLFLGFMMRPFHTTGSQVPAVYADLQRGTVLSAQSNVNAQNCYGPVGGNTRGTQIRSCLGNTHGNRGFRGGAGALVVLKSPIGDMRNKLFTRPGQPFYMPSHPLAGDTLTYNIMTACGFSCAQQQITPGRVRGVYGSIVGDVANALAGRGQTASELSELQYFDLVHNPDWPARYNPATGTAGGYAKYIPPGNWDYNKDGVLDTMTVTTCWTSATTTGWTGTPTDGCAPPFSDTLAGGQPNSLHNNYFAGVGPIKLGAGDTTSFIVAFVSVPDSISLERQVNDIVQLYNDFWLSPQPPAPVQIVSASVEAGSRTFGDVGVRLFLDQTPSQQSDPFVLEQARKLKTSADTNDIRLRVLNPALVNDIRARALPVGRTLVDTVGRTVEAERAGTCRTSYSAANCVIVTTPTLGVVDSLLVFKSCDGGTTYTATGGAACVPAPARDVIGGTPSGYAWQAYARLGKNAAGQFPSQFFDGNVTGGVTYTYVIVSQSFPVAFDVVDVVGGRTAVRQFLVRPKTQNGLSANTANRNVATVYVPASTQAGGSVSSVSFVNFSSAGFVTGDTSAALNVSSFRLSRPIRGSSPIAGRVIFSDSAVVREYDADTTVAGIDSTVVELFELVQEAVGTGTTVGRTAGRSERFVVPGSAGPVDLVVRNRGTAATSSGNTTRTALGATGRVLTTSYRFTLFQRPVVTFVVDGRPIYVTDSIPGGGDLTPAVTQARSDFIGAMLSLNTPTISMTTPNSTVWRAPGIPVLRSTAWPTISWQTTSANPAIARDSLAFGRYRIQFSDAEFGKLAPFTFDPRNPQALRDRYAESVAGRTDATNTVVTAEAAAALNRALNRTNITVDSLAAISVPFTVRNLRFGDRPVQLATLKSAVPTTALLGLGGDTLRVSVPVGKWIPGTNLYWLENLPTYARDTVQASPLVTRIRRTNGVPDTTSTLRVTWGPMRLGCGTPETCNPIEGFASSGYTQASPGMQYELQWFAPLRGLQSVEFQLNPEVAGQQVAGVPTSELKNIRAVPNPYIMFSEYEQTPGTKRLMFVGLPPKGTLRIYTASGQFVQRITWVESDLDRNCRATTTTTGCIATGDLTWNLRTHENKEIGPGFYMFVVSTDVGGTKKDRIGKFVVIH